MRLASLGKLSIGKSRTEFAEAKLPSPYEQAQAASRTGIVRPAGLIASVRGFEEAMDGK